MKISPGLWAVGRIEVLVHSEDIDRKALMLHEPKKYPGDQCVWAPLVCRRCSWLVGYEKIQPSKSLAKRHANSRLQKDGPSRKLGSYESLGEVRFEKWCVSSVTKKVPNRQKMKIEHQKNEESDSKGIQHLTSSSLNLVSALPTVAPTLLATLQRQKRTKNVERSSNAPTSSTSTESTSSHLFYRRSRTRYVLPFDSMKDISVKPATVNSEESLPLATILAMENLSIDSKPSPDTKLSSPRNGNVFRNYDFETVFNEQILAACEAHNCRNYVIRNPTGDICILLTILSTEHYVSRLVPEKTDPREEMLTRVTKVSYEFVTTKLASKWAQKNHAEVWVEPSAHCAHLKSTLITSFECFRAMEDCIGNSSRKIAFLKHLTLGKIE